MKINKVVRDKVKIDFLLIEGTVDIETPYFINEINKGIKENNNENFKTNVNGYMTSWHYFTRNNNFLKTLFPLFDYLDNLEKIKAYSLHSAWGLKEGFGNYTYPHDHAPNYLSGVIYLNDHDQVLLFPEIKKEFKPKRNSFILFSSFLIHKTLRNITDIDKYAISFNLNFHKGG